MPHSALLFGCGYLGQLVAKMWSDENRTIQAVTRSAERADVFRAQGLSPLIADVTHPSTLHGLPSVDTVLFAVGFDRKGDQSIEQVYVEGVRNVLAALPESTGRFIYISTTGVYGDAEGEWVDESTPTSPTRAGGKASLAAEQLICESPFASRAVILRLAGIYGPGRLPYLQQLKAGEPIEAPEVGYLNLIHVHDAASVIAAISDPARTIAGPVTYCVSDGQPVVRGEYYREVARQLGTSNPVFVAPAAGSPRAARAAADKRVSSQRLAADLALDFRFPSYHEGLAAIVGVAPDTGI